MRKIIFVYPKNIKDNQPVKQRIDAFKLFYENNNCKVYMKETPDTIKEKLEFLKFLYKNRIVNIFVSMPPFRNWFIFFIPFVNIILDIRDGWSIAIKTGYGGVSKSNKTKAYIVSLFEKFAITRAKLTITCTNGLHNYLEKLTSKKLLLITNGYNKNDFEIVEKLKKEIIIECEKSFDVAVCAGQFSEYGRDKIKIILRKINKTNKKTIVNLIGSNIEKNEWVIEWIKKEQLNYIKLSILPRMNRIDMYKEILKADYGIAVIRDPNYDFGTKVFDYILCQKPIFDYFDEKNNFAIFFEKQMKSNSEIDFSVKFFRGELIEEEKELILDNLR